MKIRMGFIWLSLSLFAAACSSMDKEAARELDRAQKYFTPLNDFKSVTCEVKVHLPESFKARKRSEQASKSAGWDRLIAALEGKGFSWTTSKGNCWVRGMKNLKEQEEWSETQIQFLDNLDAQMRVGNCVLLQAFYYHSPLKGIRPDRFQLQSTEGPPGFRLVSSNEKAQIHWASESKTLTSQSSAGEIFLASYRGEGPELEMTRATLLSTDRKLIVEDLKYRSLNSGRKLIEEYMISLKEAGVEAIPQARLRFQHCIARIRAPEPQEAQSESSVLQ